MGRRERRGARGGRRALVAVLATGATLLAAANLEAQSKGGKSTGGKANTKTVPVVVRSSSATVSPAEDASTAVAIRGRPATSGRVEAIDRRSGLVTARDAGTGWTIRFQVADRVLLGRFPVGTPVEVDARSGKVKGPAGWAPLDGLLSPAFQERREAEAACRNQEESLNAVQEEMEANAEDAAAGTSGLTTTWRCQLLEFEDEEGTSHVCHCTPHTSF